MERKGKNKIKEDLNKVINERNQIQKEFNNIKEKLQLYEDSLFFNVCDVTRILAELVSKEEKTSYYPVFYDVGFIRFNEKLLNVAIVEASCEQLAYYRFQDFYVSSSLYDINLKNLGIIIIETMHYLNLTKAGAKIDPYKLDITFKELLKCNAVSEFGEDGVCQNDFHDYSYLNDFIKYLYILQVQNNGKHLTYEEMQTALNNFLKLEIEKPKVKKLVPTTKNDD